MSNHIKSYAGRIKMIYIDPPYNTGNDFVYRDDFQEPLQDYLRKTGQANDAGIVLTTNTSAGGRFHSNWLTMIYPRLLVARQLLTEDGAVLISIDDHEAANLRLLLDEVFGQENFITQFVWKSRQSEDSRTKSGVSTDHEYILCYGRSEQAVLRGADKDLTKFANPDNDPRGPWRSADLTGLATRDKRPNLHYDLTNPQTGLTYPCPPKGWRFDPTTMKRKIAEGRILFPPDGTGRPRHKLFLNEMTSMYKGRSSVITDIATAQGTRELVGLLGTDVMPFPKPPALMKLLIEQATTPDSLVLDFFAGSCTTAHAILELNREEGGSRQFICVQLPEVTPPDSEARRAGFSTIAEIGKERIRRVIQRMSRDNTQRSLVNESNVPEDLGFKVFKLGQSNFRAWQDFTGDRVSDLEGLFDRIETPLVDEWTEPDLLTEVMLLQGYPLASSLELQPTFRDNRIVKVDPDDGSHALFVCLDPEIADSTIQELQLNPEDTFVCLDSALSDEAKLRLADVCNLQTI